MRLEITPALLFDASTMVFSVLTGLLLVIACVVCGSIRGLRRMSAAPVDHVLPVEQVAYLCGGSARVVLASVSYLSAVGAVQAAVASDGRTTKQTRAERKARIRPEAALVAAGPLPAEHSQLDAAVHAELSHGTRRLSDVVTALTDSSALVGVEQRLLAEGLVNRDRPAIGRTIARLLAGAIILAGVAQAVFGFAGLSSTGWLAVSEIWGGVILLAVVNSVFEPQVLSPRGTATVRGLRTAVPQTMMSSAWRTVGATTAAVVVGIYGTGAVWAASPTFAAAAGVPWQSGPGSSGSSCGGGSSCSSSCGSSCGGGCGGGGD